MRRLVYAFIAITVLAFAVGFPAYMAFGQGGSHQAFVTVTATPYFVAAPGGGGGFTPTETGCPAGQDTTGKITTQGLVTRTIVVTSLEGVTSPEGTTFPEGQFRLTIDIGTIARQSNGAPIICIGIIKTDNLPSPPEGAYVISVWYDAFPDKATFDPSATLEYIGELGAIPSGDRLVIAYYDETAGAWVELDSVVDTEANTITAKISHFSDFAVFGYGVAPPAAFQVSSLSISPRAVYTGETVTITLLVTNTGGQAGSYQVILKINGVAETTQEVTLDAGASEQVSFTTTKEIGTYSVDINGVTGAFEVRERPVIPPTKHCNWWLIILIIVTLLLAAETTYVIRKRRKHGGITGALSAQVEWVTLMAPKLATKIWRFISKLATKVAAAVRSLLRKIKIKKG